MVDDESFLIMNDKEHTHTLEGHLQDIYDALDNQYQATGKTPEWSDAKLAWMLFVRKDDNHRISSLEDYAQQHSQMEEQATKAIQTLYAEVVPRAQLEAAMTEVHQQLRTQQETVGQLATANNEARREQQTQVAQLQAAVEQEGQQLRNDEVGMTNIQTSLQQLAQQVQKLTTELNAQKAKVAANSAAQQPQQTQQPQPPSNILYTAAQPQPAPPTFTPNPLPNYPGEGLLETNPPSAPSDITEDPKTWVAAYEALDCDVVRLTYRLLGLMQVNPYRHRSTYDAVIYSYFTTSLQTFFPLTVDMIPEPRGQRVCDWFRSAFSLLYVNEQRVCHNLVPKHPLPVAMLMDPESARLKASVEASYQTTFVQPKTGNGRRGGRGNGSPTRTTFRNPAGTRAGYGAPAAGGASQKTRPQ